MTSFTTITPEEYKILVDNEKKILDLNENFTTPETLKKYRHTDKNIEDKILKNEKIKEKYENLDKIINISIDSFKLSYYNEYKSYLSMANGSRMRVMITKQE